MRLFFFKNNKELATCPFSKDEKVESYFWTVIYWYLQATEKQARISMGRIACSCHSTMFSEAVIIIGITPR